MIPLFFDYNYPIDFSIFQFVTKVVYFTNQSNKFLILKGKDVQKKPLKLQIYTSFVACYRFLTENSLELLLQYDDQLTG